MRIFGKLLLGLATASLLHVATAQTYPDRPVRLIVPYSTGGGTDLMARIIGLELSKSLGQPVVVDNKPGAGAVIGTDMVSKARPDGYTIGLISSGHAINPALFTRLPFDPVTGIEPVMQIASGPNVIVVNTAVPARSLAELVRMVKKEANTASYGSAGVGNPTHLAGELFQKSAGARLIHIPYKGSGQAEIGLAGGEITMMIDSIPAALPFIASGRTRALAVTGSKRFPLLADVPTAAEAGMPDLDMITWWGVIAPPGTPAGIVSKLHAAITTVLGNPEVRAQFLKFGAEPVATSPSAFGAYIKAETDRYARLIASLGIQPLP